MDPTGARKQVRSLASGYLESGREGSTDLSHRSSCKVSSGQCRLEGRWLVPGCVITSGWEGAAGRCELPGELLLFLQHSTGVGRCVISEGEQHVQRPCDRMDVSGEMQLGGERERRSMVTDEGLCCVAHKQ